MEDVKRGRGRPKGSGDDDSEALTMVARLVLDSPTLKRTTAMKRVRDARLWRASNDEALIRRWQMKWKASGAVYLQRVSDERAEAERQRLERDAAMQARQADRSSMWEIAAGMRAAGPAPGSALQKVVEEWAARDAMMRPSKDWLAIADAMPKGTISRADLEACTGLAAWTVSDAMRSILETANASGLGAAMQKHGMMGRALEGITAAHMPKLPKGF